MVLVQKIIKKTVKLVAILQLISVIGLALCSIWYGAWYPDAQANLSKEWKKNGHNISKPDFWDVSFDNINFSSPVAYTFIVLVVGMLSGAGGLKSAFRLEELEKRETEFKKEQEDHSETQQYYYEALKEHLTYFFCHQIEKFDDRCRASVYRHDKSSKMYRMVFRYSEITRYEAKGRVSIPEKEGVIGATYLNGDYIYISNLPIKKALKGYYKETSKQLSKSGAEISENTLRRLNMPSRCYYGYAIRDPSTNEKFAILIVESTEPNQFDAEKITEQLNAKSNKIAKFVRHIAHIDSKLNPYGGA